MLRVPMIIARRCTFVPLGVSLFIAYVLLCIEPALAAKLKVHNTYGSPIDTLKNTHLTTTVPAAKDFVRATSPDKDKLDYAPLTGTDPDRPKPRDPKGIEALQAELESARAKNEQRAKGLLPRKAASRKVQAAKSPLAAATR